MKFSSSLLPAGMIGLLAATALLDISPSLLRTLIALGALGLTFLYLLEFRRAERVLSLKFPFAAGVFLFLFLIVFQMIPLPEGFFAALSPRTAEWYEKAFRPDRPVRTSLSVYNHATSAELSLLIACVMIFYLTVNGLSTAASRRRVAWAVVAIGGLYSLLGPLRMEQGLGRGFVSLPPFLNLVSPLSYQGHFVAYLEAAFFLLLGLLLQRRREGEIGSFRPGKFSLSLPDGALFFLLLLMFISPFLSTLARSPLIVFPLGLVLMFILGGFIPARQRRKFVLPVLFSVALFLSLLVWFYPSPRLPPSSPPAERLEALRRKARSFTGIISGEGEGGNLSYHRLDLYRDTVSLIREFPVFGVGAGNFRSVIPIFKRSDRNVLPLRPHNEYLRTAAETGLLGSALLLSILFLFFRRVRHNLRFASWRFVGSVVALSVFLLEGLFTFPLENPALLLLFSVLAGLIAGEMPIPAREYRPRGVGKFFLLGGFAALGLFWGGYLIRTEIARFHYLGARRSPGEEHRALTWLRRAAALDPGNAEYLVTLGEFYWKKSFSDPPHRSAWRRAAERRLQAAAALNPLDARLHYRLGRFYEEEGENARADLELGKAVLLWPTNPHFLCKQAERYLASGEEGLAVDLFRRAALIRPVFLGRIYDRLWEETRDYLALREVTPRRELYYRQLGRFFRSRGETALAERAAREAGRGM